jgi:hypothetical protein
MSETGFNVSDQDLIYRFQQKIYGISTTTTTGYFVGGVDLSNIFQPYDGTSVKANLTGFQVNGNDLNNLFQNIVGVNYLLYNPFSASTNETGLVYKIISVNSNFNLLEPISNAYIVLVGGGGGGGAGLGFEGGGAGGAVTTVGPITLSVGAYSVSIGTGGDGGQFQSGNLSGNNGISGGTTTVSGPGGFIYTAAGGSGGGSSSVGNVGAGGTNGTSYGAGGDNNNTYTNIQSGSGIYRGDGQNGYLYTFQDGTNTTFCFGAGGAGGGGYSVLNPYLGGGGFVGTRNGITFTNTTGGCGGSGSAGIVDGYNGNYFSFNQINCNTGSGGGGGGNNQQGSYNNGGRGNNGLAMLYFSPTFVIYNNANGTETQVTQYNKIIYYWTAPISGYFVKFLITATGALNNGNLINILLNRLDQNGNFISTIINGQWYNFSTYTTQTINIPVETYLNAGDQIYLDYSTMENGRYFYCLERSDGVPVISIYLDT